ncbi:hypothetical protein Tco_0420369 [Tanacetum coccineum]
MAVLESCPKHNMVTYLEKTDGNTEFHEIISFLTRSSIHYALTVSHVVSTTFVEQFWMSAKSKIINNVRYITSKVAGKPVSISETSIRSDLLFYDADVIDSLPNQAIFDAIQLMGYKGDLITNPSPRPSPTTLIPDSILKGSSGNHGGQSSSDSSLSGNEGGMKLQSVYDLCISLCTQVTDQAKEIKHLKAEIKKLKKKAKPVITHHKSWIKSPEDSTNKPDEGTDKPKVSTDKEEVSTDRPDEGTVDQNEGRSATQTAPTTTTLTIFGDDETIAQVLIIMSQNKEKLREKEKGVKLKDVKETERPRPTSTRSLLTLKPLPKIDLKDKSKKMIEEEDESDTDSEDITETEKKFKQLARDEEVARKVQEDWQAEKEVKKLAKEEATKVALSNEYDFIQARLNADKILAEKLQKEEREMYIIEQRAKFLHDTIVSQRRFLAQQRSEAIRNKPPSKNQLRNQMITY